MLRVETSNLPNPRNAPRSRRLLPLPPGIKRPGASKARHEMLPPREHLSATDQPTVPQTERPQPERSLLNDRWSVRLELADAEIAKLYGQGMARGAVVWKRGMEEWRPLLITPELSGLLRRTRTTLDESPPLPSWSIEPSLPRPARLPSHIPAAALADGPNAPTTLAPLPAGPTTVAPMAMDVEPPAKSRRTIELVAVGLAAFALAWIGHGRMATRGATAAASRPNASAPAAAPAACEPTAPASSALTLASTSTGSAIRTVSIADLPLAGTVGGGATAHAPSHGSGRTAASRPIGDGPPRDALVGALGQVARAASGCGERGGPVRVVMSFASSGVARSIQVTGPDLPAATRSCIIGAASRARVPAFTGDPVTVSKTL